MPRKIKIVDLVNDETNEKTEIDKIDEKLMETELIDEKIMETEPIDKKLMETEPIYEKLIEKVEMKTEEPNQTTKVRTNQLHECAKCGKWMTLKTLKYIHDKTCNSNNIEIPDKKTPKKEVINKKSIVSENIKTPNLIEKKEEVRIKSFEELRQEHLKERIKHRTQKMSNLFSHAF